MGTVVPQSELCKRAVAWISEEREGGGKSLVKLIEEAAIRFNLGPKDCEFLERFFTEQEEQ